MWIDDDLALWIAFEAISVAYGDHLICPACDVGILIEDGSGAFSCDICDTEFSIEE
jgi:ribosomal protein L37AE/L43A